jgi:large subunit ribosomal protein L10
LAFTKKEKSEMLAQYGDWLTRSQAVFMVEYKNMKQKDVDTLRLRIREIGGEMHVLKNTLFERALGDADMPKPDGLFEGTSVAGFAFTDAAGMAKVINELTRNSEVFKVKGGFLGKQAISDKEVKSLAELPALPVMRARILGMLNTPASQLARTLAEPGRSIAAVVKAYSEKQPEAASA